MQRIVLIGAGRVASQLGPALRNEGVSIEQVVARTRPDTLAGTCTAQALAIDELSGLIVDADLYLLAVSDGAIRQVSRQLAAYLPVYARLVHTSGATPLHELSDHFHHRGVFYPLQTFSDHRTVDFREIPFCIEASTTTYEEDLLAFAKKLSSNVHLINGEEREVLHVAAVFANNFTNHLYAISQEILDQHQLPFDLLRPLIRETASKVQEQSPRDAQTGPSRRGDQATLDRHLAFLRKHHPEILDLYEQVSKSIEQSYGEEE